MTEGGKNNPPAKTEPVTNPNQLPTGPRKKKSQNCTRRFNDEQIRLLESVFKSDTKLEPRKKLQLARELGLQPRQVSIWFQNRRARWKSKQIEQDYRVLKANYDNLCSQFESLKEEKQSLLIQLQRLWDLLKRPQEGGGKRKDLEQNRADLDSDQGDGYGHEFESKPSNLTNKLDNHLIMYSNDDDDEERRDAGGNFGDEEEPKLGSMEEAQADGSFASPKKWCSFNSGGGFDQSCGSSNWWDSWT